MGFFNSKITIIYCDSRKRDSTVGIILKKFIEMKGGLAFVSSRRNFSKILKITSPQNVLLIGQINILFDLIYEGKNLKKDFIGMNIYFYPAEGFAMSNEYKIMYPERYNYYDLKKIFFWGTGSYDWAKKNLDGPDYIFDKTGYPRLKMAKVFSFLKKPATKKIGFVGRFPILNDLNGVLSMRFLIEEFTSNNRYKSIQLSRLQAEGRAVPIILKTIKHIIDNTSYSVSFRPHPNEDRKTYIILRNFFGSRFELSNEVDVAEWMAGCEKIIGLASSSYVDAALANIPVICLDKISETIEDTAIYEPALKDIYEIAYLPETFDDLINLINDDIKLKKSNSFDKFLKNEFIGNAEDPIKHVADNILISKPTLISYLTCFGIEICDFFLLMVNKMKNNASIDFDFSSYEHKRSDNFVNEYINFDRHKN